MPIKAPKQHGHLSFFLVQSSYISGIAQGANVGKDQVIILGVTSGSSVTVNTQVMTTTAPDFFAQCRLSLCRSQQHSCSALHCQLGCAASSAWARISLRKSCSSVLGKWRSLVHCTACSDEDGASVCHGYMARRGAGCRSYTTTMTRLLRTSSRAPLRTRRAARSTSPTLATCRSPGSPWATRQRPREQPLPFLPSL